jgi:hypothetical protein
MENSVRVTEKFENPEKQMPSLKEILDCIPDTSESRATALKEALKAVARLTESGALTEEQAEIVLRVISTAEANSKIVSLVQNYIPSAHWCMQHRKASKKSLPSVLCNFIPWEYCACRHR